MAPHGTGSVCTHNTKRQNNGIRFVFFIVVAFGRHIFSFLCFKTRGNTKNNINVNLSRFLETVPSGLDGNLAYTL